MLFRRRRPRSEDDPAPGAPVPTTGPSEGVRSGPPAPEEPAPRSPPHPEAVPPPLPAPPSEPGPRATGVSERCFVCRTPLENGTCPKCRMTWVE